MSQIIGLPIVLIHFESPRRGQPLYKGQNTLIYIGPKVSFVRSEVWLYNITRDIYTRQDRDTTIMTQCIHIQLTFPIS